MKYIITIFVFMLSFSHQENQNLNGNYKIIYIRGCGALRTKITFKDSLYVMTDSPTQRGKITYGKTLTSFDSGNIVIDFKTSDIKNDTIDFQVHNRSSKVLNYLDVSVASGKFIRIK